MAPLGRPEGFERDDLFVLGKADRQNAAARRDAVDEDRAGAAFAQATAVFRTVEAKIVAQQVKQRRSAFGFDPVLAAVDPQPMLGQAPDGHAMLTSLTDRGLPHRRTRCRAGRSPAQPRGAPRPIPARAAPRSASAKLRSRCPRAENRDPYGTASQWPWP